MTWAEDGVVLDHNGCTLVCPRRLRSGQLLEIAPVPHEDVPFGDHLVYCFGWCCVLLPWAAFPFISLTLTHLHPFTCTRSPTYTHSHAFNSVLHTTYTHSQSLTHSTPLHSPHSTLHSTHIDTILLLISAHQLHFFSSAPFPSTVASTCCNVNICYCNMSLMNHETIVICFLACQDLQYYF